MRNVEFQVKGSELLVKIDLAKEFGPSKTGKTIIVASTEGNQKACEYKGKSIVLGVNAYYKPEEK